MGARINDNYLEEAFISNSSWAAKTNNIGSKGAYFYWKCFITRLVHVQSGDKFCDHWPTNFGEPSKGNKVMKRGKKKVEEEKCWKQFGFLDRLLRYHVSYNSTLRGGYVTHHEYIQVDKGRDVGMNQISLFEAKVANGNGEQTLRRDVYRLGRRFDFYRMLSFYFTTVGFYFSSMVTMLTVYVFLYGRLYLVLSGMEKQILEDAAICQSKALEDALATQSVFQLGLLLVLPMVMEIGLEIGFRTALGDFVIMQL
ncbi:hypothetical protein ACSBR1_006052 [Camellia fascicularis]